jgi:hypothetical protein
MIVEEAIGLQAVLHDPESNFELLSGTSYGITPRLLWPVYRLVLMRRDVAGYRNGLHRMRTSLGNGLAGLSRAADDARSGLIDDMLRPAIFLCAKSMATADAQAAVMAAGGAAVAYRKKTGAWPTAAGADWPQDPCDSRPLRMQAVEDRLRIWSVGSNLKDDGGVSGGKDRLAGDVVLELRPPR